MFMYDVGSPTQGVELEVQWSWKHKPAKCKTAPRGFQHPSILLRLSRPTVEQLRNSDPSKWEMLLNIIDLIRPPPPKKEPEKQTEVPEGTVKLSKEMIAALRGDSDTVSKAVAADHLARALRKGEKEVDVPRRSARVAAQS